MKSHGRAPPNHPNGIWFSERKVVAQIIAGFAIKRYMGTPDTHLELYVGAFCRSLFEYCADLDTAQWRKVAFVEGRWPTI